MKFDGHVKLTCAALKLIADRCPTLGNGCHAPMFRDDLRIWLGDRNRSTAIDNYSAAVVSYVGHSLAPDAVIRVKLPDAVAFVDLDEMWTHDDPEGQRYHFMRASNETHFEAYTNACRFIKTHTENWVNQAKVILKRTTQPLVNANLRETKDYTKQLALALHSLQDAFSPGHTARYYGEKTDRPLCEPGYVDQAAPIRELFDYSTQDHDKHAGHDYDAGTPQSWWGAMAVEASVALISMGIVSVPAAGQGLVGWDAFQRRWLPERIQRSK